MKTSDFPVVAVPARNEEKRLPRLLSALARQSYAARHRLPVVIVLNNCTDDSWAATAAAASSHPELAVEVIDVSFPPAEAHVGSARRLALDTALSICPSVDHGVLLTTDADAMPAPNWVDANLRHIAEGADLVGGVIVGDPAEEAQLGPGFRRRAQAHAIYSGLADQLSAMLDPIAHDPWPRHHDHTGASLALRAAVYAAVGGLPVLPRREDIALVSKVREAGYRLRHPLDVRVDVSARLVGRASGGMADCLKEWMREEAAGMPLLVEDPCLIALRLDRRRMLRSLDSASPAERHLIASTLDLDPAAFYDDGGTPLPAVRLIERLAADKLDAAATMPVETAIAALEAMIEQAEGNVRAA
jgi:hypothetical protein